MTAGELEKPTTSDFGDITVIEPSRGWFHIDWPELWRHRELFWILVWRDIKVAYTQTLLGAAWAVLVPLLQMIVFSAIFGGLAKISSDGLPKPIFYYVGLLPWTYFATSLTRSSNSIVNNANLLTRIYLPRVLVPAGPCVGGLVDFSIAFSILVVMMFYYHIVPPWTAAFLPLLLLDAFLTAFGGGMFLAALNVRYRDIRFVVPFLTQIWMYCTVIVPFSSIPARFGHFRYLYGLNPMAGVIEGFRWCLLHPYMFTEKIVEGRTVQIPVEAPWLLISLGLPATIIMLGVGLFCFRRMEDTFADIL